MSLEKFSDIFEKSLLELEMRRGAIAEGKVVSVDSQRVIVDVGLKSDAVISRHEFRNEAVHVGETLEVVIKAVENGFGETRVSYEDAKRAKVWRKLEAAYKSKENILGTIMQAVKGGFTVEIDTVRAFLPGSLVDIKPVRNPESLEGQEVELKVIKMDTKRNNIVVSRRAVMQEEFGSERAARLESLQEGQEILGIVKNITDYGAFVDLGGVDGLLHITDMAWKRVKHPSDLLAVGDELRVKVLKFDKEKNRVSLGVKQLGADPWVDLVERHTVGTRSLGKVTNITDYGCFVELEEGIEGLVHMSEMDWTNKNVHPNKVVSIGQEVEVIVLDIDQERRRISLGIKQCQSNPWEAFAEKHKKGEVLSGKICSITDFGIFIGLDGNIDGLVHLSDISWSESGEEAIRQYKKGDEIEALILGIDPDRERISLGIKQLEANPTQDFLTQVGDSVVEATVSEVEQKQAFCMLPGEVPGVLRVTEYMDDHVQDLRDHLKVGEVISAKVVGVNAKQQVLLSHKALMEEKLSHQREKELKKQTIRKTTLGDLLREQMNVEDKN
eukprot:TRINITY_DN4921_c0_g1_i1.p1 TRINITY_DN4921_c0_g1~~TRINITY_DN4921_c0_g1_i1.p1  ORF type:complete len:555 (+),score=-46.05 TRINITY_DN4921_c0_g1_i1:338-2002(+)